MSSQDELLFRLLKMYPVKTIRHYFHLDGLDQETAIKTLIAKENNNSILAFCYENFGLTKQHLYLFSHNIDHLTNLPKTAIVDLAPYRTITVKEQTAYFHFLPVRYTAWVQTAQGVESLEISFLAPVRIAVTKKILSVEFTIIEKNIASYLDKGTSVIKATKDMEEEQIITKIRTALQPLGQIVTCDLNKGIKYLWQKGVIDAPYVKYKKAKSTSVESMDEDFTLREQYPKLFDDILKAPLGRSVFRVLQLDGQLGFRFAVDPTEGRIIFPTFSQSSDERNDIVGKILEHN